MNTISLLNALSNSKVISSTSIASISIPKSFSYESYNYYVFSTGRSFTCDGNGNIDYLIIGGGGAGGGNHAGGGGAGGVAFGSTSLVSGTTYTVTVGAGGTGGGNILTANPYTAANNNGGNSSIVGGLVNIIAYGGGYGGGGNNGYAYNNGTAGNTGFTTLGSGGGGMAYNLPLNVVTDLRAGIGGNGVNNASYGFAGKNGGVGFNDPGNGGGGGGSGTVGGNASANSGGNGGNGLTSTVLTWLPKVNASGYMNILTSTWSTATSNGTYIAAGGGGGSWAQSVYLPGTGGLGGGGGANVSGTSGLPGSNGTNYTGSGGGGGSSSGNVGGSGGSGLVIFRIFSSVFSLNTVPFFSPNQITGLNNWYDGSDPNGTGSAPTNGTSITSWIDKSTNANHMLAQAAGTYASNTQNGLGAITFNNSWYRTTTANAPYPMDGYVVVKLNSITTAVDVLGVGSRNSDDFNSLTFSEHTTSRWHNGSSNFSRTPNAVAGSNETSTGFLLMSWSIANNNFYIYRNGVQIMSSSSYTWGRPGDNEFRIGSRLNINAGNLMKGSIAEVLFYNSPLSTTDRQKVEGYLATKWGLITSLPISHPYSSALVLHWPFDTTMNESVNNYTPTLYGTIPAISNIVYKVGTGSLNCSGPLSYVMYTNPNGILPISNTYTFSFWYYPTSSAKYNSHLFAFSNSGGNDEIGIYFNKSALDLYIIMKNGSSSIYSSAGSQITNVFLTVNTWNHIALSITSTSSNIFFTLWRNNSKTTYTRASSQGIPQVARQFAFINGAGTTPIPPGSNDDSATTAYIDDFRVYTTLLTDAEVTTLYNAI